MLFPDGHYMIGRASNQLGENKALYFITLKDNIVVNIGPQYYVFCKNCVQFLINTDRVCLSSDPNAELFDYWLIREELSEL